jgi:D-3-phosphoglycerate dehydrogenase / 2-oxoglutarate reductase
MKVIVADLFSQAALDELVSNQIQVVYNPSLNGDSLKAALQAELAEVLVVRSTKVTSDIISNSPALEFIIRAGAGTDNIDTLTASKHGIFVANCPGKNSVAVAELTIGHIISIDRRLAESNSLLKQGKWNKGLFSESQGLKGKTLGIIGLGAVGKEVAIRGKSFELDLVGIDPMINVEKANELSIKLLNSVEEIARVSDIITFHVPAIPETKGIIDSKFLSWCKESVIIVNTSRGDVANEQELLLELERRPNLWYATDVYIGEPSAKEADFVSAIAQHPRVYGTHHTGASTKQAENAIGQEALRMILQYSKTRKVDASNLVNLQLNTKAKKALILRYNGQALVRVLTGLAEIGAAIQEIQNSAFKDGGAFTATINFDSENLESLETLLETLKTIEGLINYNLVSLT